MQLVGALCALFFGLGGIVAAVLYKMGSLEERGDFDRDPGKRW